MGNAWLLFFCMKLKLTFVWDICDLAFEFVIAQKRLTT